MAVVQSYFPDGKYPQDYSPALPDFDYNPSLGELLNGLPEVENVKAAATSWSGSLPSGLVVKVLGKDFAYQDGVASGGTISEIHIYQSNGKTAVLKATGLKLSFEDFADRAEIGDAWNLAQWIFNGADTFKGSDGDDDQFGGVGNDVFSGNAGFDYMTGGSGRDTYDGGADHDTINFSDAYGDPTALHGISLDATKGTVIDPWDNNETFKNVEGFRGTQFKDTMLGSSRDEEFVGFGGADVIDGNGGIDKVRYDKDANRGGNKGVTVDLAKEYAIDGFGRKDVLRDIEDVRATYLADTVTGSAVSNRVELGDGKDTFIFNTKLNATTNVDTLVDFHSPDDTIKLEDAIFLGLVVGKGGVLAASAFKMINTADDPNAKVDTNDRIIFDATTEEVFYDRDGSGTTYKAIKFAQIGNEVDIGYSDFTVV